MKLIVIGGTRFVGRAFVELAVRHGHDVAVFHRSVSEPEDFPSVEHLHGDRDGQRDLLRGRSWDAVFDTCAYVPRAVREASADLRDAAGHYTLVSTLSVHRFARRQKGCVPYCLQKAIWSRRGTGSAVAGHQVSGHSNAQTAR